MPEMTWQTPAVSSQQPVRIIPVHEFLADELSELVTSAISLESRRFLVLEVSYQAQNEEISGEFSRLFSEARARYIDEFDSMERWRRTGLEVLKAGCCGRRPAKGEGIVYVILLPDVIDDRIHGGFASVASRPDDRQRLRLLRLICFGQHGQRTTC